MRAWFFGLMTLVPLGVLGASCALGTFEKIEAPVDAGIDLGCQHTSVPLPPNLVDADNGDAVSTGDVEFTAALRTLRMKYAADGGPLGLDLDRYCSCQGETPSCVAPEGQDPELSCDLPAGRDNSVAGVFRIIEAVLLFPPDGDQLSELYSEFAHLGRWSVLLHISGYNGLPNDSQVRVEWFPSGGTLSPQWTGNDVWPVVPSAVADASPILDDAGMQIGTTLVGKYSDDDAYVTNGQLVFSLAQSEFTATNGVNRLSLIVTDGTGMARIVQGDNGYYLEDGILAGRVKLGDLFQMVASFRDHNGAAFCANPMNPYWGTTRDIFCRGLDIQVGSPQPNKKCDAMSVSLGFEAQPAHTGGLENPPMGMQFNCNQGEDMYSVFLDAGCPTPDRPPDASPPSDAGADADAAD